MVNACIYVRDVIMVDQNSSMAANVIAFATSEKVQRTPSSRTLSHRPSSSCRGAGNGSATPTSRRSFATTAGLAAAKTTVPYVETGSGLRKRLECSVVTAGSARRATSVRGVRRGWVRSRRARSCATTAGSARGARSAAG